MLFARTGTPPHCFASSLPQATAAALFFVLLVCAWATLKSATEIRMATDMSHAGMIAATAP
jgi:hypothetical protein